MNCAPKVDKLGNSPNGNKLQAKFTGAEKPDACCVKGTNDLQNLRGNSGVWLSGANYMSPQVTLELIKNGVPVKECSYDLAGDLITTPPPPTIVVTDFNVALDLTEQAPAITWKSNVQAEDRITFRVVRADVPTEPPTLDNLPGEVVGSESGDSRTDNYLVFDYFLSPVTGTHAYILIGEAANGDRQFLAGKEVTF